MTEELFSSTPTPLTPPELEEDRLSWLRLYRSRRVGVSTFYRLMGEHGTAQAALTALPSVARAAGVEDYEACSVKAAEDEIRLGRKSNARLVFYGERDYPIALAQLEDAPPMFWAIGDLSLLNTPMVAVVGARNASSLGERMAKLLGGALSEAGFVVVSGLARGIDAAAHSAAMSNGTVAVLAGGADTIYPKENASLFYDLGKRGLRISEQALGLSPHSRHFPPRNRIISGLSHGVVVVEAAAKSGSLITARTALDQGREVMAVPGHPFDARAAGCNMLIRDGARLVRHVDDIMEALGSPSEVAEAQAHQFHTQALTAPCATRPQKESVPSNLPANGVHPPNPNGPKHRKSLVETAQLHQQILARLGPSPIAEDQLIRDLHMPAQELAPALLALELDGRIARQAGGLISRTP
ncbi:MAG: DNA-processing protein DprA [Pseudomonadota bacterium]